MLEGNVRNTGVHACGVIICRDDVSDWVPVSTAEDKETGEKLRCTQYEGSVIEDTGLIKMDFLGLKTLSIIKECQANIYDSLGMEIDVDALDITDPATYRLYCDGRTIGFVPVRIPRHTAEVLRIAAFHLRGPYCHECALPSGTDGLYTRLYRP